MIGVLESWLLLTPLVLIICLGYSFTLYALYNVPIVKMVSICYLMHFRIEYTQQSCDTVTSTTTEEYAIPIDMDMLRTIENICMI